MDLPELPVAAGPEGTADEPDRLLTVADGEEKKLDPRSIHAARMVGGIVTLIVVAGGVPIVSVLALSGNGSVLKVMVPVWLALIGLMAFYGFVWPALSYRHTSYRLDPDGIRIRRGVLWRSEVTVPRSRVQHTDVSRGPIERYFDLATLVIHTAGTQHASVSLGGLADESAYPIRDYLLVGGSGDAV